MKDKAIVIENLTKKYGELVAVKNLSLEVNVGEVFGLLGPNGAGKSTTIRTALGLLNKTSGTIKIFGMDSHRDSTLIRKKTGYLPGDFGLIDGITVRSFLRYLLKLQGGTSERKMLDLAERLDLDLSRKTHELSKGNRQKVGIVQALMDDQELIILDEPTTGLDPLMQQSFYEILREEKEKGHTVFMSSHVLAEVESVCDRVAIIKDGMLVLEEDIHKLQDMTGKVLEVEFREAVDPSVFNIEGVSNIHKDGRKLRMTVHSNVDKVIKKIAEYKILNISMKTYSLEELFMKYYRDDVKRDKGKGVGPDGR